MVKLSELVQYGTQRRKIITGIPVTFGSCRVLQAVMIALQSSSPQLAPKFIFRKQGEPELVICYGLIVAIAKDHGYTFCCEKKSACGHWDTVYPVPVHGEALAVRPGYGVIVRWARRSTGNFFLGERGL